MMPATANPEDFWRFSCQRYAHQQVQALCLGLQDEYGLNVNVLLFCCYLDSLIASSVQPTKIAALSVSQLEHISQYIAASQAQLQQHRELRRAAKANAEDYQDLLQQELALEKEQQGLIVNAYQQAAKRDQLRAGGQTSATCYLSQFAGHASVAQWQSVLVPDAK